MCFCVVETSSALNQKSSVILRNLWQFLEILTNVRKRLSRLRTTFGESSEFLVKCSETFGKTVQKAVISLFI